MLCYDSFRYTKEVWSLQLSKSTSLKRVRRERRYAFGRTPDVCWGSDGWRPIRARRVVTSPPSESGGGFWYRRWRCRGCLRTRGPGPFPRGGHNHESAFMLGGASIITRNTKVGAADPIKNIGRNHRGVRFAASEGREREARLIARALHKQAERFVAAGLATEHCSRERLKSIIFLPSIDTVTGLHFRQGLSLGAQVDVLAAVRSSDSSRSASAASDPRDNEAAL